MNAGLLDEHEGFAATLSLDGRRVSSLEIAYGMTTILARIWCPKLVTSLSLCAQNVTEIALSGQRCSASGKHVAMNANLMHESEKLASLVPAGHVSWTIFHTCRWEVPRGMQMAVFHAVSHVCTSSNSLVAIEMLPPYGAPIH